MPDQTPQPPAAGEPASTDADVVACTEQAPPASDDAPPWPHDAGPAGLLAGGANGLAPTSHADSLRPVGRAAVDTRLATAVRDAAALARDTAVMARERTGDALRGARSRGAEIVDTASRRASELSAWGADRLASAAAGSQAVLDKGLTQLRDVLAGRFEADLVRQIRRRLSSPIQSTLHTVTTMATGKHTNADDATATAALLGDDGAATATLPASDASDASDAGKDASTVDGNGNGNGASVNAMLKGLDGLKSLGANMREALRTQGGTRDQVVMVRTSEQTRERIDSLIEAGLFKSRSECSAFLIDQGLQAQAGLLVEIRSRLSEIRRIKQELQDLMGMGDG